MITLTSEVKEKIVEETNKGKYDQIENIKSTSPVIASLPFEYLNGKSKEFGAILTQIPLSTS